MKKHHLKSNIYSAKEFVFILLTILLSSMEMKGSINFAYDAAGNRIKRELVISQKNKAPGNTTDVKENYYDSLGEKNLKITSDASGIIQISINDFGESDTGNVSVYSVSGICVLDKGFSESYLSIDLSSCQTGVYILCVRINDNKTTWKINKK